MIEHCGRQITLIGEVKTQSPSGFISQHSWQELFEMANKHPAVDIISIHTDLRWGGSFELLEEARRRTEKPILAKGYHSTDEEVRRAFNYEADYALVVGRIPDFWAGDFCWYEPLNLSQLRDIHSMPGHYRIRTLVWNARDLSDPTIERYKTEKIEDAREIWPKTLIQASSIRSREDISPYADGILVGSNLPQFLKSL